ncbi:hypothetical protein SLA2020_384490 [Shorea laevis]
MQAKEVAKTQTQEEADANLRRKLETAHQSMVADCQLHKDDTPRLMEEPRKLLVSKYLQIWPINDISRL